ncbi:hypothetical protein [Streptomyces zhihengii]|uniref:hypothetical protein n=1 Tax=Streptomyces zhihengii TaxID=1818004 RepID=UPI0033B43CDF
MTNVDPGAHTAADRTAHAMTADHAAAWLARDAEMLRTLALGDDTWTYQNPADLVLTHGTFWTPSPWPRAQHPERHGECFAAAHEWADREGWTYVEGLVLLPDVPPGMPHVFDHAWCLTADETIADPAIPDGWAAGYLGVPYTRAFRHALQERAGTALVTAGPFTRLPLTGYNTEILRHGLPPGALPSTTTEEKRS